MHALAGQGVQVGGQGGHQGLAFTGLHLGNGTAVQGNAAHDLHREVLHAQHTPGSFAADSKGIGQDIIQRLAVCQPLFQGRGLRLQLGIGHRLILCFQCQHLFGNGIDLFQLPVREAAKEFFSKGHCYTSSIKNRGGRPPNSGKTTYCLYDTPKLKTRQTRWIDFIRFLGELSVNLEKKTLSGIAQQ